MDTKLTLRLSQDVIQRAKHYAAEKKLSLSRLIENYLNAITAEESKADELEISPFVKSLSSGTKIPSDYDYKKEYPEYLNRKYQ